MKKRILLIAVMIATTASAIAQKNIDPAKAEEIFNSRVKFMQEQLKLTPAQTEKFVPIYKNYLESLRSIKRDTCKIKPATQEEAFMVVKKRIDY